MSSADHFRADKYLWSVRLFKTRSFAAEACRKGKVIIEGIPVKPSRIIKPGEIIVIIRPPVNYSYLVIDFPKSRVSAKIVSEYIEDKTSAEELAKLKMQESFFIKRDKGTGRPTKKERRVIDKLRDA